MPTYKILVLTPKILENHLTPDKIPSLEAFSLIIFDECHHTRKGEPYNSVMKSYLKSKKKGQRMPQIVGLTASIGVEKATTVEKAKDSILGVMGNLDVMKISTVKENVQELRDTVPRPEEMLVDLIPRDGDDISNKINNIMMKLEEQLTKSEARVDDKEIEEVRKILARRPGDRREQKYGQWAVALRNQVRLLKIPSTPADADDAKRIEKRRQFSHEIQILADSLVAYNEALDVHDLTRPQDVLDYLQQKFLFQRTYKPPEVDTITLEKRVLGYLTDLEKMLERDQSPNPNLDTLALTIMQHLMDKEGEESHIIIFVRTRATCQALCNWMNSRDVDEILRQLNAMPFTGSGAHQDQGGMTQNMQESVIEKFRSGEVKLIVSTSVGEEGIDIPECNLTIKYNHVGNEVTTVQTRGRSRKRGGQSVLLAMPRIIMQERVNRQREQYMIQAIQLISNMRERDISKRIVEVQKKTLEAEEIEEVVRKVKKLPRRKGNFSLACCQCYKVRVDGSQIRKIQDAHRVIVGNSLKDKVTVHTGSTTRCFDEMEFRGSVICRCKNRLGQLLIYKGVRFMTLGLKYWVVMDDRENPSTYKKWKDMPYAIEELSAEDIKEQLRTSGYDIDEDEEAADEDSDY
nr:hypothetical protein BaRGS_013563 [Batillaria attramentaria]